MRFFSKFLTFIAFVAVSGCGSSGSVTVTPKPQPTDVKTATLKLTAPDLGQKLAGFSLTITLPDGVTPTLNSDGSIAATTAVAVNPALTPVMQVDYTAASGTAKGKLLLAVGAAADGFTAGEFVTLKFAAAAGNSPLAADFILSNFDPLDLTGIHLSAGLLQPTVSSYLLQ